MKQLALSIFILIIFSCSITVGKDITNTTQKFIFSNFDPDSTTLIKETRLSDIYEMEKILLLDFPEDMFFEEISNVKIKGNRIFLLDSFGTRRIFVFGIDGKYLYTIDDYGEGPDKYSILMGFTVSHDGKEALVLDSNRSKIMHYDASNGKLLRTSELDFIGLRIARLPNSGYVFTQNDKKNLVITDNTFKVKYEALDQSHGQFFKVHVDFTEFKDKTTFQESYNENIYNVGATKTEVWRKVPTPDYQQLEALKREYPVDPYTIREFMEKANSYSRRRSYTEYENGFAFFSLKKDANKKFVKDFSTGKSYEFSYSDLVNDMTFTRAIPMFVLGNSTEDYLGIGYVNALNTSKEEILANIKKYGENEYSAQMKAIANKLTNDERDQLIFCLFKLKSNLTF
ncbi:6-bladed beta-propeller [Peijinzhouia sedimentorum]